MANSNLTNARNAKNDEFYTQYHDIEKEVEAYLEYDPSVFRGKTVLLPCDDPEWSNFTKFFAQNFDRFGLKKLISTSYAVESKLYKSNYQPTLFEVNDPQFDEYKTRKNGKIFTLTRDLNMDGKKDYKDIEWRYLKGDGDFKSKEIKKLRDEADIIVTNPPFSLFREFLAWIVEANKQFLVIGNINAITYKELFPLIQSDKLWLGATNFNKGMYFKVPTDFVYASTYKFEREQNGEKVNRVPGVCWFTNIDHGRRHQPLPLMTMADNLKFSKHKEIKGKKEYDKYENYDGIDVPFTDAIPSDYDGVMGVPITFLDKYSPEQFEIIWQASGNTRASAPKEILKRLKYKPHPEDRGGCTIVNGNRTYGRILIKHRKNKK
jgi:hypothetical protein